MAAVTADHLGDEVGVAPGESVHLDCVESGTGQEPLDAQTRQRRYGHATRRPLAGQLAEGEAQRRGAADSSSRKLTSSRARSRWIRRPV